MSTDPPEIIVDDWRDGWDDDGDGGRDSGNKGHSGGRSGYDAPASPSPGHSPRRPPRSGANRWVALGVAAILFFALGYGVGTHRDDAGGPAGLAGPGSGSSSVPPSSVPTDGARTGEGSSASGHSAGPSRTASYLDPAASEGADPTETVLSRVEAIRSALSQAQSEQAGSQQAESQRRHSFATVMSRCGDPVPAAEITGLQPLPAKAALEVIAGPYAATHSSSGAWPRLFPQGAAGPDRYISDLAPQGSDVVATISTCDGHMADTYLQIRRTPLGSQRYEAASVSIDVPDGSHAVRLLAGGSTLWALLRADGAASGRRALMSVDAGGHQIVPLPSAFVPVAARGDDVVGTLAPTYRGGSPPDGAIIQIFNTITRGIVDQIPVAVRYFTVGRGFLVYQACSSKVAGMCALTRYDFDTGRSTDLGPAPAVGRGVIAHWLAVSPDGSRIAMAIIGDPALPPDAVTHGGNTAAARLVILDTATGELTPVPGVAMGSVMSWVRYASVRFTPDSGWVVVGAPSADGTRVIAYDADLNGPYDVGTLPAVAQGLAPFGTPLAVISPPDHTESGSAP